MYIYNKKDITDLNNYKKNGDIFIDVIFIFIHF